MEQIAAERFVKEYFHSLFVDRDVDSLDRYLTADYWDDDIGRAGIDHIENSKEYLRDFFAREPTIGVDVEAVTVLDEVITSYLYWFTQDGGVKTIQMKGVALFQMRGERIAKRHTYLYWKK